MEMCEKCDHKVVCGRFQSTGGKVKKCEHYSDRLQPVNAADRRAITNGDWVREMPDKELAFCILCPADIDGQGGCRAIDLSCMEC